MAELRERQGTRRCRAAAFLVVVLSTTVWAMSSAEADEMEKKQKLCDIHRSACTKRLGNRTVTLDVNPKPVRVMTDLVFRVTISGKKSPPFLTIDLKMPGMNMGPNQVHLKSMGEGVYEGSGIIVRCPSGRRIWQATVTVPDEGAVDFVFDVVK